MVIGAGIVGAPLAYHLAGKGAKVAAIVGQLASEETGPALRWPLAGHSDFVTAGNLGVFVVQALHAEGCCNIPSQINTAKPVRGATVP